MEKSECKEGQAVSWVQTRLKGSGVEMKTVEGTVVALEDKGAMVKMRNNRRVFKKYENIEPIGTNRDLRQFMRAGGMEHALPKGA